MSIEYEVHWATCHDPMTDQLVETRELIREMRDRDQRRVLVPVDSDLARFFVCRLGVRGRRWLYPRGVPDLSVWRDDLEHAYQRVTRKGPQDPDYAPVWD